LEAAQWWTVEAQGRSGVLRSLDTEPDAVPAKVPDAADQLRTVMRAEFTAQPLLNKSEARLFGALDKLVVELAPPGWQVMAQVSLGEILRCADADAYRCINSKRVDLLIVDAESRPVHAIEYQGNGHYLGAHATAARDAVKKEALRRAGIGYEEVVDCLGPTTMAFSLEPIRVSTSTSSKLTFSFELTAGSCIRFVSTGGTNNSAAWHPSDLISAMTTWYPLILDRP
jgi:hypothetical protein